MGIVRTYAKPASGMSYVVPLWALSDILPRKPKAPPPPKTCNTCSSGRIICDGYRAGSLSCLARVNGASLTATFDCSLYTKAK